MLNKVIFSIKNKNCNIFTPLINSSKKANIMKKNYFYLVLLLLSNLLVIGQTVTLTPITVNGANVSSSTINLGSVNTSTVLLSVKVALKTAPNDSDPGTITIYSQKSASASPITPTGGKGGGLLFSGSTSAQRDINISLEFSNFDPSGGILYAEYKTSSNIIYKSGNLSVIRQSSSTGGGIPADAPNPANIANTLCCNQIVRLGDKPAPIQGSQYENPYENYSYGINSSWSVTNSPQFTVDNVNKTLNFDYTTELKNIEITRSLGYKSSTNLPNKSNTVTITVVPSPIIGNEIYVAESTPNTDGFVEIINTNPKQIFTGSPTTYATTYVNLDILADPNYVQQGRASNTASIERYEWQYKKTDIKGFTNQNWITIENEFSATLNYFTPENISNTEDNYFFLRRIAIYKNIRSASNTLKLLLRNVNNNNIICCDQVLAEDVSTKQIENPSLILGSTPSIENLNVDDKKYYLTNITYQWQSQSITNTRPNTYGIWTNIAGATSKDYLPLPLQYTVGTRGGRVVQTTYNYRRIAIINYAFTTSTNENFSYGNIKSYSNEINVQFSPYYGTPKLLAYPNPATSIIYIENKENTYNLVDAKINIINMMGTVVNTNNFSTINPNLISIDVSNLAIGTYFVNIITDLTGRGRNQQIGFIKTK